MAGFNLGESPARRRHWCRSQSAAKHHEALDPPHRVEGLVGAPNGICDNRPCACAPDASPSALGPARGPDASPELADPDQRDSGRRLGGRDVVVAGRFRGAGKQEHPDATPHSSRGGHAPTSPRQTCARRSAGFRRPTPVATEASARSSRRGCGAGHGRNSIPGPAARAVPGSEHHRMTRCCSSTAARGGTALSPSVVVHQPVRCRDSRREVPRC